MRKIIPILVVNILLLSGIGAVGISYEEQFENKTMISKDWALQIKFNGELLGYQVTVENLGNEIINRSLSMNITTDAWIIFLGRNLEFPLCPHHINLSPGDIEPYNPGPVIGFGPATIKIDSEFVFEDSADSYSFEKLGRGFVLLTFTRCDKITITLP